MTGVIFTHTLRRNWRQMIYWGVGIGLLGIYIMALIPNVEMLEQMARLLEVMPPQLMAAFGAQDASMLTKPEGLLSFGYFSYVMLILASYAVVAGLNVTAVEEDRGILDLLMSAPVSRAQLVIEKLLAYSLIIFGIILVSFLCLLLGSTISIPLDLGGLLAGSLNMFPAALTVLGFSAFISVVVRSRATALALAAGFVVVGYFIDFIGNAASQSSLAALRAISFYSHYGGGSFLTTGVVWSSVLLLIVVGVVLGVGSIALFQRRDIGL